jgi:hypothetical protein
MSYGGTMTTAPKNCAVCSVDCDFAGNNDGYAEECRAFTRAVPLSSLATTKEIDELHTTIADLAMDIQEIRESFNRILCAIRKETQTL